MEFLGHVIQKGENETLVVNGKIVGKIVVDWDWHMKSGQLDEDADDRHYGYMEERDHQPSLRTAYLKKKLKYEVGHSDYWKTLE